MAATVWSRSWWAVNRTDDCILAVRQASFPVRSMPKPEDWVKSVDSHVGVDRLHPCACALSKQTCRACLKAAEKEMRIWWNAANGLRNITSESCLNFASALLLCFKYRLTWCGGAQHIPGAEDGYSILRPRNATKHWRETCGEYPFNQQPPKSQVSWCSRWFALSKSICLMLRSGPPPTVLVAGITQRLQNATESLGKLNVATAVLKQQRSFWLSKCWAAGSLLMNAVKKIHTTRYHIPNILEEEHKKNGIVLVESLNDTLMIRSIGWLLVCASLWFCPFNQHKLILMFLKKIVKEYD